MLGMRACPAAEPSMPNTNVIGTERERAHEHHADQGRDGRVGHRLGRYDVLVDGETIAALLAPGSNALGTDRRADTVIDATGKYVIPGGIDGHTHMEMPFGGTQRQRHVRDRHPRGGVGRHDHHRRLRRAGARAAGAGPGRAVAREGRRQLRRRLRLPPDHRRGRRRVAQGDGRADRRGHHQLQAVHGLPGRVPVQRRADRAGHADGGRQRRADHDARRERLGHRRAGAAGARARRDRRRTSTASPARGRPSRRPRTAR